ncbi:MAG: hypothetical protein V3T42_05395 [Nitrospirales bacterium]
MVRTVLWLCMGVFFLPGLVGPAFSQDALPLAERLGLRGMSNSGLCHRSSHSPLGNSFSSLPRTTQCAEPPKGPSFARFNFVLKRETFNLQQVRDIPSLINKQGGSRLLQATYDTPLFNEALTAGVKMAYRDPFLDSNKATPLTNRMGALFVLKGDLAKMKYRAEYGYSGQEVGKAPSLTGTDQVGGKFVWEWKLPHVTPKMEFSRFGNNVEKDSTRSQTIATQQKFSLNWKLPDWPSLALTYSREQKDIFIRPGGSLTDAISTESALAKLSIQHTLGSGAWSSHYKTSEHNFGESRKEQEFGSTVDGTFHLSDPIDFTPRWGFTRRENAEGTLAKDRFFANLGTKIFATPTLTFTPGFEFKRDLDRFDAMKTDTLSAKLGYSYNASDDSLRVSMLGQYILNQTSNTAANPQSYDLTFLVQKDLHDFFNLAHSRQTLSLKIVHNQQINSLSAESRGAQTSAMLLVSIIP